MKLKKLALGSVLALAAAAAVGWQMLDKETRGFLAANSPPTATCCSGKNRSAMPPSARSTGCRSWPAHRVVAASGTPSALPPGPPLNLPLDVDAYMQAQRNAGPGGAAPWPVAAGALRLGL
jgi:hypothetical protein